MTKDLKITTSVKTMSPESVCCFNIGLIKMRIQKLLFKIGFHKKHPWMQNGNYIAL